MLISPSRGFIFFHVAKTGGLSVRRALEPFGEAPSRFRIARPRPELDGKPNPFFAVWEALLLHATAADARRELPLELWERCFKFAFVRNPWDLQVSMYHFILREPTHVRHALVHALGSFEAYLSWMVNTPTPFPRGATRLQSDMLVDKDGRLLVDFIGHFEHLEADFAKVCRHLDLQVTLPHENKTEHRDYRSYYTAATRALVEQHFAPDILRFGYSFDAPRTSEASPLPGRSGFGIAS